MARRRKISLCVSGLAVALAAGGVWLLLTRQERGSPLRPAVDTTFYTAPLHPDGSVDYVTILRGQKFAGVTADNNVAVLIVKALGRSCIVPEQTRDAVLKELSLADLPPGPSPFERPPATQPASRPAGLSDSPPATPAHPGPTYGPARRVEELADRLDLLVEAAGRERFYLPLVSAESPPRLNSVARLRVPLLEGALDLLATRAELRAARGHAKEAWRDATGGLWLALLLAQDAAYRPFAALVDARFSRAIAKLADSARPDGPEARRLLAEVGQLPRLAPLDENLKEARLKAVERLAQYSRVGLQALAAERDPHGEYQVQVKDSAVDWNQVARGVGRHYERLAAALREPTYEQRQDALSAIDAEINGWNVYPPREGAARPAGRKPLIRLTGSKQVLRFWLAPKAGSYLHLGYRGEDLAIMHRRLARVALAVAAFRAERGKLPAALAELSPDFLADIPPDVFTEGLLACRRDGQSLVIYSVGPNRRDDGGRHDLTGDADDLAIEFRGPAWQ